MTPFFNFPWPSPISHPITKATIFTKSTHQSKSAVTSIHSFELCKTNFSSKKTKP
jgi:hypothetical protein